MKKKIIMNSIFWREFHDLPGIGFRDHVCQAVSSTDVLDGPRARRKSENPVDVTASATCVDFLPAFSSGPKRSPTVTQRAIVSDPVGILVKSMKIY